MAVSIDIRDLEARRGTFCLSVPELFIASGEVFAILGTTGSGKTVLLEAIAGAFPLEEGEVLIDGVPADEVAVQDRGLGILYQDHALFPHMTVRQNIEYGARVRGVPSQEARKKANELMALFGIEGIAESYPGAISGGESQRTALSRALMVEPDVLLLDEPFSALDPATKKRLYSVLEDVHDRFGCTMVFVTHDFNEAHGLADRVGIVLDGKLRAVREASELFDREDMDEDVMAFLGLDEETTADEPHEEEREQR